MIVKYNILGYLIGEGFGNVLKNKKSTGASLMIMCATMIIFGVFLILGENINYFVDEIKSEQGFQVFLVTDATDEQIGQVGDKIRALEGVSTAEFKTKEYATSHTAGPRNPPCRGSDTLSDRHSVGNRL
mgnify:CR=1 FL=1